MSRSEASSADVLPGAEPGPVPARLHVAAASRLVSQAGDPEAAGRRLIQIAPEHGIDLSLLFGIIDRHAGRERVRQACLAVPGAGRTAMMFISEPMKGGDPGGPEAGACERAACVDAVCRHLSAHFAERVRVAQALPDPRETHVLEALSRAGFKRVGDLRYLRRPLRSRAGIDSSRTLPPGIMVRTVRELGSAADSLLPRALDRSYVDTLDCPELCGVRETADILASHRSTGVFCPDLWWVVFEGEEPEGCMLLSPSPEQRSVELVYLGLSPRLRGRGLGATLLGMGLSAAAERAAGFGRIDDVTCAVDQRNAPAIRTYDRAGFRAFASRVALVRKL